MNYIKLNPRETTPGYGTRITSWWLDGARERTGRPLFISGGSLITHGGGIKPIVTVWESHRPHGVNQRLGQIDGIEHWLLTWADVDAAIERGL